MEGGRQRATPVGEVPQVEPPQFFPVPLSPTTVASIEAGRTRGQGGRPPKNLQNFRKNSLGGCAASLKRGGR